MSTERLEFIPPPHDEVPPVYLEFGGVSHQVDQECSNEDPMQNEVEEFEFDKTIRNGFIKKIYSILMCQLLTSFGMISLFLYYKPIHQWFNDRPEIYWVTFVVIMVVFLCMVYCSDIRRKPPMNLIFLILFTLVNAFLLSITVATYDINEILLAVGIIIVVCLGLTLFAFQTKADFTGLYSVMVLVMALTLITFGIFAIIWPEQIMSLVYAALGALIFSLYLTYNIHLIVVGKLKYSLTSEECIFAALNIPLGGMYIFIYFSCIYIAYFQTFFQTT